MAWRVAWVFLWVYAGLWAARLLMSRLDRYMQPLSKRLGIPASLILLTIAEARSAHAVAAEYLKKGEIGPSHVVKFSLVTWPFRTFLMHLRLGIVQLALSSLGPLGAIYLGVVYLPSLTGLAMGLVLWRGAAWPSLDIAARAAPRVNILKTSLSIAARYAAFETLFLALDMAGLRIDLSFIPLSPEAVAIASIAAVRPSLGIMAAAPAYWGGRINAAETLAALLIGRLLYMSIYEFPRSTVQFYGAIYPPGLAGKLVLYTAAVMYAVTIPTILLLLALSHIF